MIEEGLKWFFGPDIWGWGIFLLIILCLGLCAAMCTLADKFNGQTKIYAELHYKVVEGLKRLEALEKKMEGGE